VTLEQTLQNEVKHSQRWIEIERDESTYKRHLRKRVQSINWVLENMKDHNNQVCNIIETRTNEFIDKINKTESIFEADPLDSKLRILDWISYQVCSNEIKKI